ncbi:MAG: SpoIIE family protein phosphatase [bacterium]|nr:SpoIIE family protein phosphatase [bacterium]
MLSISIFTVYYLSVFFYSHSTTLSNNTSFANNRKYDNIYIYRNKEKKVESISVNTIPFSIGLTNDLTKEAFEENSFQLKKDDILLLATDGIVEAAVNGNYKKEQLGNSQIIFFMMM